MNHKIVSGDKRILDPDQFGLIGQTLNVIADRTVGTDTVNTDPNTIIVPPVAVTEAGSTKIVRTLNTSRKLNANNQYAPSMITLAIESTVTKRAAILSNTKSTNLQGILKYGTGMANQGTQSGAALSFASIELDPRILFDLVQGTMLSFPASYFQLDLLYTAVTTAGGGETFVAGEPLGPNYQVVYSLGYEPQVHPGAVTMTQFPDMADLNTGDSQFFFRPKYSTGVYFLWSTWTVTPLQVFFYNAEGAQVWAITTYAVANPPAILPWPADAIAVNVTNATGSNMPFFKCVSVLGF
jgi:hypothetical protein